MTASSTRSPAGGGPGAGLRPLKLATIRVLAAELLRAKTQRWEAEEVLRTLIECEIAARHASNDRARVTPSGSPGLGIGGASFMRPLRRVR